LVKIAPVAPPAVLAYCILIELLGSVSSIKTARVRGTEMLLADANTFDQYRAVAVVDVAPLTESEIHETTPDSWFWAFDPKVTRYRPFARPVNSGPTGDASTYVDVKVTFTDPVFWA
jgi:hypothetical protein